MLSGGHWCDGNGHCGLSDKVERTTDSGSTFEELAPLPYDVNQHCLKVVDEDTLFVAGGHGGTWSQWFDSFRKEAYLYRFSANNWTELNLMTYGREGLTCSLIENQNAQQEIVVTGGWDGRGALNSVEIWNFNTEIWRAGEGLPQKFLPAFT